MMGIKQLLLETIVVLAIITCTVIFLSGFQIHRNAARHFKTLQNQYFDATYQIYQNNIVGDLLVGQKLVTNSLLNEIAHRRKIGIAIFYKNKRLSTENPRFNRAGKSYKLDLGNKNKAIITFYPLHHSRVPLFFKDLGASIFLEILVFGLGFVYLLWRFRKKLLSPLTELVAHLKLSALDNYEPKRETVFEIKELGEAFKEMNVAIKKKVVYEAEANAAKQVAHDIRSPLATFNRLLESLGHLPEKERILLTNAIHRITDISNNLLSKYQSVLHVNNHSSTRSELISVMLDSMISEKRVQHGSLNCNLQLIILDDAYCIFSVVNDVRFKQAVSNLIDNAFEAITKGKGKINVILSKNNNRKLKIVIEDNGCGIENESIQRVLQGGVTTKKNGHGMGLSRARESFEAWGGALRIESVLNVGTKIIILLPESNPGEWFASQINITQNSTVVILDDDESIHQVWNEHFASSTHCNDNINLIHFYGIKPFYEYYSAHKCDNLFFLIDYNLLDNNFNGLSLIKELGISARSILVTNQYDDVEVRSYAEKLSVKIIPKNYASHTVIHVSPQKVDCVLLDDDTAVLDLWEFAADQSNKRIVTFSDYKAFKTYILKCDKDVLVYIDAKLHAFLEGETVCKELYDLGYFNVYLCTGYPESQFNHVNWVKGVVDKRPPF